MTLRQAQGEGRLAAGARVLIHARDWTGFGTVQGAGETVEGFAEAAYRVRLDEGVTVWVLPCAVFALGDLADRPRASFHPGTGRA